MPRLKQNQSLRAIDLLERNDHHSDRRISHLAERYKVSGVVNNPSQTGNGKNAGKHHKEVTVP